MFQYFSEVLTNARKIHTDETIAAEPRSSRLRLISGAWSIPRAGKTNGGEDAHFIGLDNFAGVADGVGEWGEYGCCPRQFAYALMEGSKSHAKSIPFHTRCDVAQFSHKSNPSALALDVLKAGFIKAQSIKDCFGSSTSLIVGLDPLGEKLGIACLGDSSCIVLRRTPPLVRHMTIAKRTREQQHFFNCPYQLAKLPQSHDVAQLEAKGLYELIRVLSNLTPDMNGDAPEKADLVDINIKEGDLLLIGTDGLFDNLFDHEIISLASLALSPYESRLFSSQNDVSQCEALQQAREITEKWVTGHCVHPLAVDPPVAKDIGIATPPINVARGIAEAAYYRSLDGRVRSPFSKAARAVGGSAIGGKQDDITVVACWVVSSDGMKSGH